MKVSYEVLEKVLERQVQLQLKNKGPGALERCKGNQQLSPTCISCKKYASDARRELPRQETKTEIKQGPKGLEKNTVPYSAQVPTDVGKDSFEK